MENKVETSSKAVGTPEKKSQKLNPKVVGCVLGGCAIAIVILASLILGAFLGIEGQKWLIEHNFITDEESTETANAVYDQVMSMIENDPPEQIVDSVDQNRFIKIYDQVSEGVVSIAVTDEEYLNADQDAANIGTGFVVDESGIIVTNNHVVENKDYDYVVVTKDGSKFVPTEIIVDVINDIAIVKIDPEDKELTVLKLGDSDGIKVGEEVVAIGSAMGEFTQTVTSGIVSGTDRVISYGYGAEEVEYENVIQTDAAINPGNSGGPLINLAGEVVGVNFMKMMYLDNLGFCIPINTVKERVVEYKENGKFMLPYLGVQYSTITYFDTLLDESLVEGALVKEVVDGSPAQDAGILEGDIITKVDGEAIESALNILIQKHEVGDRIKLEVYRGGKYEILEAVLEQTP